MIQIQAINDIVIAEEVIKTEETLNSGIILPQTIKMEPQKYGIVTSVGEQVTNVKVGDTIIFHQAGGQAIMINGKISRVLKNPEVYGIVK
jgi:co-chaperonin GroES (HSP10)